MEITVHDLAWLTCLSYLSDMVGFAKSWFRMTEQRALGLPRVVFWSEGDSHVVSCPPAASAPGKENTWRKRC